MKILVSLLLGIIWGFIAATSLASLYSKHYCTIKVNDSGKQSSFITGECIE